MMRAACSVVVLWFVGVPAALAADGKYRIQSATVPAPDQLSQPIRKLLDDKSIKLLSENGAVICELWFAKAIPVKATQAQIQSGLTYREIEESTVMGAVRFEKPFTDYRKQKIKPGVYTLRLGFQPMDGDHMGTAPYNEFCLLIPAKIDAKPDMIETKDLRELSGKAVGGSHPGVMLLYPNEKPTETPEIVNKDADTWVLTLKRPVTVGGKNVEGGIGLALTLIGHTTAE